MGWPREILDRLVVMPNDEYHREAEHWNHSKIECARRDLHVFKATFVDRQPLPPKKTPSFLIGSAVHCLALEGEKAFNRDYAVEPHVNKRTKAGKAELEAFRARYPGRDYLTIDQYATVRGMVLSMKRHPVLGIMLDARDRLAERTIFWKDSKLGVPCKARFDLLSYSGGWALDLKTSRHPRLADDVVFRLGYHRAAAHYLEGAESIGFIPDWHWAVVGNSPPYTCVVRRPSAAVLNLGKVERLAALEKAVKAVETGVFNEPGDTTVEEIDVPDWYSSESHDAAQEEEASWFD